MQFHSNFIIFKPVKKEIRIAEPAKKEETQIQEVLVVFTAVEKGDDAVTAKKAIDDVKGFLQNLKINRILIYPFAHLSNNLSKPAKALEIINEMEVAAKKKGIETFRAPFGWTKQFQISIKGHPLAEQSRFYAPAEKELEAKKEEMVSEAIKAEEKLKSHWYILQPNCEMKAIKDFDFRGYENLEKFSKYEISKVRASQQMPPHVPLMKRLEIADYEPGSDPGNLRWYPKGRLIKSLLEQLVTAEMNAYGAMEVETPVMYDFNHSSLSDYLNRFPARQYLLRTEDKDLFLRFSACFGQFLMVHDTQFSYRQMPLKLYELTRYSFRREKSGEVCGLRRQRAFTMPDCHAFCTDLEQAKQEFKKRFNICINVLKNIGLLKDDYEIGLRFTKDFYEENTDFISNLVEVYGKPILAEVWEERFFYFRLKWDANFIDNQDKAAALSTDQIDVENAKRYEITYVDENGNKQYPLILHCSPSGGIERCIYALLEKAYKEQQSGKLPMLPLWISPTQIRLIPISDKYMEKVEEIAKKVTLHHIRVDIDDRAFTLQKKVREAETEWVPYIIVVGQRELDSGVLSIRDREIHGKIQQMGLNELVTKIRREVEGKPYKPLPLPLHLSKRPQFYG